jgi:hypothetical protein
MKCSPDISSRKGKYVEDYAIRTLNAAEKFCT